MPRAIHYDSVADLYDSYVRVDFDLPFFLQEAQNARGKVLELTSGTGRVSIPLLQAGIDLTCVDSSEKMLSVLRTKLEKNQLSCNVIRMDMAELSLPDRYSLIFIPFHSFSEIVDTQRQAQALSRIHAHLTNSGHFLCTLHNPAVRITSMDGRPRLLGTFPIEPEGTLVVHTSMSYDVVLQIARGIQSYELYDGRNRCIDQRQLDVSFYLFTREEFERLTYTAGFQVVELYGDYDYSPFNEGTSPFMIWKLTGNASP